MAHDVAWLAADAPPAYLQPAYASRNQSSNIRPAQKIIAGLKKAYPDAHCELDHANPLELLVATILSAQCTDKRVNLVTAELFKKYRSAADYAQAAAA